MSKTPKRSILLSTLLATVIVTSISCVKQQFPQEFIYSSFKDSPGVVTLCFDLQDDARPMSGVVLKLSQAEKPESHLLILPFDSLAVGTNREIYSTWGSYDSTTLITYYTLPHTSGIYGLGIIPVFGSSPEQWFDDPRDLNQSSIFLLRFGLTRHFIFKYSDIDPNRKQWLQEFSTIINTCIDSIGVAIPQNAFGREIKKSGRTSTPSPMFEGRIAKFYPSSSKAAQGVEAIHIKYELPPNKIQQRIVENIITLIVVLFSPGIQLIVLKSRSPESKKLAKLMIWIVACIQFILFTYLLYKMFTTWEESFEKALGNLVIAILEGLFTGYVFWQDKKSS